MDEFAPERTFLSIPVLSTESRGLSISVIAMEDFTSEESFLLRSEVSARCGELILKKRRPCSNDSSETWILLSKVLEDC